MTGLMFQEIFRIIPLKYAGTCVDCSHEITVGTRAYWDPATSTVRCIVCPGPTPDPFDLAPVDRIARGVPGRSAGAEAAKRGKHRGQTWRKGEEGEIALGRLLDRKSLTDRDIEVIHDRVIPGSKRNIDHIVVAASGVFVINAKKWSGKIEIKAPFLEKKRLIVGGRNRTNDVKKSLEEGKTVQARLDYDVPVSSALCFVEGEPVPHRVGQRRAGGIARRPHQATRQEGSDRSRWP